MHEHAFFYGLLLSCALAMAAYFDGCAVFCAIAPTVVAGNVSVDFDLFFGAFCDVFEGECDFEIDIKVFLGGVVLSVEEVLETGGTEHAAKVT